MRKKLITKLLKKTLLLSLSFFCFSGGSLFAQIQGGGGIIHVTGDPDAIVATQDVDINEGNICFDRAAQIVYFFDPSGATGDQWTPVSVGSFTDTDTRLTNPTVSGGNLTFDILDVIAGTTSGSVSVAILDIAPVQDIVGTNDIDVTDNGSGTYTIDFTETTTSLTITADTLFFEDEDGTVNKITLPTSDGSDTEIVDGNSVTVSGTGTAADPYILEVDGANTAGNAGMVPVTDGSGTLTWTDAVTGAEITAEGALQLNMTDGNSVIVDLDDAPKVGTVAELNAAVAALTTAGHPSGIVISKAGNTFGLPSTSQVGVIFFIKQ